MHLNSLRLSILGLFDCAWVLTRTELLLLLDSRLVSTEISDALIDLFDALAYGFEFLKLSIVSKSCLLLLSA